LLQLRSERVKLTPELLFMPALENRSHRVRDFFLYIVIGVAVAALAILLGVHQAKNRSAARPSVSNGLHSL
jgi:hypothetical protein